MRASHSARGGPAPSAKIRRRVPQKPRAASSTSCYDDCIQPSDITGTHKTLDGRPRKEVALDSPTLECRALPTVTHPSSAVVIKRGPEGSGPARTGPPEPYRGRRGRVAGPRGRPAAPLIAPGTRIATTCAPASATVRADSKLPIPGKLPRIR